MKFFEIPSVIRDEIYSYLPKPERINVLTAVCKESRSDLILALAKESGVNYSEFVERVGALRPPLRYFLLSRVSNRYTLSIVERISHKMARILSLSLKERQEELLSKRQVSALPPDAIEYLLSNEMGILALSERLITPVELAKFFDPKANRFVTGPLSSYLKNGILEYLLTANGILALHEKLITLNQLAAMPSVYTRIIFSGFPFKNRFPSFALLALREKLITPEQIAAISQPLLVGKLFSSNGFLALREKLITPEQVVTIPAHLVVPVFSDQSIRVLRLGLMTLKEMVSFRNEKSLSSQLARLGQQTKEEEMTKKNSCSIS